MDTIQRLWANGHYRWAGVLMLKADMRYDQQVPDGENFLNMESFDFLNFWASDRKLGTLAQHGRGITTLCKKLG